MKNLSIKTFFTFLLLSLLIMGAVYSCLYFFTPYAGADKYLAYIDLG